MARKAKKRLHRMPKLSFLDKLIYWNVFLLLCALYLLLLFVPLQMRYKIAFADGAVLAAEAHGSLLWLIVPWMTFFLMTFILWYMAYEARKPIFGLKNFKYGPPAWPKVYPLFMKNKPPVWVSERKKKERKQIAVVLLIVLLISFIPFPWGLYGRDCLLYDGSIVEYNMFNSRIREFTSGDVTEVKIGTYRYTTGKYVRSSHWDVRMVFVTESGHKYIFEFRDFRRGGDSDARYWLEAMLCVMQRFDPGTIRYDGAENLDRVIGDNAFDQEEIKMLYQLFGQPEN